MHAQQLLNFWFSPEHQPFWFAKNEAFDGKIRSLFSDLHLQASQAELSAWRQTAEGSLAEIMVLDQLSRNLYRDQAQAFAYDGMALVLAQHAIQQQFDMQLSPEQRSFLYMPFMHSESKAIHVQALELFQRLGNVIGLDFERQHKAIIDRFGRYPHRNAILGRESTAEELLFLTQPNSGF